MRVLKPNSGISNSVVEFSPAYVLYSYFFLRRLEVSRLGVPLRQPKRVRGFLVFPQKAEVQGAEGLAEVREVGGCAAEKTGGP